MKKFNILLMVVGNPIFESYEELGICYIASYLRKAKYPVKIISESEELINYEEIYQFQPDFIGFTVYNESKHSVFKVIQKIKQQLPNVFICLGGYMPSYHYHEVMNDNPQIDFIIRGEGEESCLELVNSLYQELDLNQVKGLTYRSANGRTINNPYRNIMKNISVLPFPARDIVTSRNLKMVEISTSRGCMMNCSFCLTPSFWENDFKCKWRGRDIDNVITEIKKIKSEYGINNFNFTDCSFEDPPKNNYTRLWELINKIISNDLNITYRADFRADFAKTLNISKVDLLWQSGLYRIFVGVESASSVYQRFYNKSASTEDNHTALRILKDKYFITNIGFINFNPHSTFEDLKINSQFLYEEQYASIIYHLTSRHRLYKGTKVYNQFMEQGLLINGEYSDEYGYTFTDKRIGYLAGFLYDFFFKSGRDAYFNYLSITLQLMELKDFMTRSFSFFTRMKQFESFAKLYKELYLNFLKRIQNIYMQLNENNYNWFCLLLHLSEQDNLDWSEASQITRQLMNSENIKKTIIEVNKLNFSYLRSAKKINASLYTLLKTVQ